MSEISPTQPAEWPLPRKLEYLDWAERVVSGCRDGNLELAQHFDAVVKKEQGVAAGFLRPELVGIISVPALRPFRKKFHTEIAKITKI